mmetsp:Transcript_19263/g.49013  ORF Transcript_19263/g.49013 Transcript_19263/m.49013 type:complete len:196 (+) Transcript_19263:316-903(+)
MAKRVTLAVKMTADHVTMNVALAESVALIDRLLATEGTPIFSANGETQTWADAFAAYKKVEVIMVPHLLEEEDVAVEQLRDNFTAKEIHPIESKMAKALPPWALGHLYRRLGDETPTKRAHAVAILGVPGFIFDRVLRSNIEKYQYEVGWLVEELKTPASHGYWDEQRAMYRASKGCGCGAKPAGTRGQRAAGTI